ncbi:hypothetical protein C7M84_011419 [Penaeus vannamei]|uniref:Glycosyltransferase family 92 protein n=1 Tax=Penaeus vannamei TaxID=6689 RepID=A0A3R7QKH6_PENVA|nr:uncharacterized protein LOC113813600 [Penaeus vannamei]ROT70319.1 hypothetical protein C7M84_011419 [Penaeus vannamei]
MNLNLKSVILKLSLILLVWVVVVLVILRNSSRERLSVRNFLLNGNIAIAETAAATAEPTGDARALPVPPPVIVTETDGGKPATSCSCKAVPLFRSDVYQEQLSQRITWLNMSSLELLMKNHPNFPYSMIVNTSKEFCELLPSLHEIEWDETYYQVAEVPGTTYFLYSAFLDNRPLAETRPCIRVLAFTKARKPTAPWCYIWFNATGPPAVSQVTRKDFVDWQPRSSNHHMFYVLTCRVPETVAHLKPLAVSIVRQPCEKARTLLQVTGAMQRNNTTAFVGGDAKETVNGIPLWNVAVCGPALFYYHDDISIRLVEWFELLRAMGFARVFLLQTQVHPNIEKVLRYYEAEGFTSVTKFSYPGPYANEPNIRRLWVLLERRKLFAMENMYFTDCLLRHMHEYRFISHFDPDEMPMLPNHDSFPRWLYSRIQRTMNYSRRPTSYDLNWRYHHDDLEPNEDESLPEYLWFLRHTRRANIDVYKSLKKPTYDMDVVTGVFSHGAVTCVYGKCLRKANKCPRKVAYLGHYRRDCGEKCLKPGAVANESSLLQYKDTVASAVKRVLVELELI